jgi:hypothetical protein
MSRCGLVASVSLLFVYPAAALAALALQGGGGRLTFRGGVGPLHFDRSRQADVIAFAGRPAATASLDLGGSQFPHAFAMGYSCREFGGRWSFRVDRYDYCRMVFFINLHTHRLAAFYTAASRRYSFRSAYPGMSTRSAERRLRRPPVDGCIGDAFFFGLRGRGPVQFAGFVAGAHGPQAQRHRVFGGHLVWWEVESNRYPVGLLFC